MIDWKQVPSLSALRAFDATARRGSFSAAARELNVTHAAIAQHVRGLEDRFGTILAFRQGQRMELTDPGLRLAAALAEGFSAIADGVAILDQNMQAQPLKVTLTPSFAENWLMRRLGDFWRMHPGVEIALFPSVTQVDLRRDGFDLAIRFGDGNWPEYEVTRLASAHYILVARPDILSDPRPRSVKDLFRPPHDALPILLESIHGEQALIAKELSGEDLGTRVKDFETSGLLMSAGRAGHGVLLVPAAIVEADLANGSLVMISDTIESPQGYHILTRRQNDKPSVRVFKRWLMSLSD